MASITLQFVEDSTIVDPVIKWYSHGWATHVDTVIYDQDDNQEKLLGARMKGGVSIRPLNYNKFKRIERVTLPVTQRQYDAYHDFLFAQIGKPYDDTAILGFAFGRDWRADGHWMCSEMESSALEHCKFFPFPLAQPANRITPTDLLLAISARVDLGAGNVR
jgi:hypothetical protein